MELDIINIIEMVLGFILLKVVYQEQMSEHEKNKSYPLMSKI